MYQPSVQRGRRELGCPNAQRIADDPARRGERDRKPAEREGGDADGVEGEAPDKDERGARQPRKKVAQAENLAALDRARAVGELGGRGDG